MEVEIKFKVNEPETVERFIRNRAEFVIEKVEEDHYFNHPCRDFKETDEALRIRKDSEGVTVTYKGKKIDKETKTREEIKIKVDNFDRARMMLEKLGFRESGVVVKRRKIFRDEEITICFDHVDGLGYFIEFEIESEDVEKSKEKLFRYAETLGFDRGKSIRKSYLEMVLDVADNNREG